MIQLTRRDLLAGTAATTAALSMGLTPSELRAAAPLAGKQNAGFYRYKVGDFEVTQLADGARTFPMPDTFVVNQKKEDALAAAEAAYMPKGQVMIPFNPIVVNTGSKLVVIDTGNGLGAFEQSKGAVGQMNANMTAAGINPKHVDIVMISHFHGDHINGLKKPDGSLVFPNAEIMVPAAEWAFWSDEGNAGKANGFNKPNFANVKKVFDGAARSPSSRPARKSRRASPRLRRRGIRRATRRSRSSRARASCWCSPTSPTSRRCSCAIRTGTSHSTTIPRWRRRRGTSSTTWRPPRRCRCRLSLPFPALGHIEKDGKGYRLVPVAWQPSI